MAYSLFFLASAERDLKQMDAVAVKRILEKMLWFSQQSDPLTFAKRLADHPSGDYRFRIGDYRVIVVVNAKARQIRIMAVGHRSDIYR